MGRCVGGEERADDELAGLDGGDLGANLFDDAAVLVPYRRRLVDGVDAVVVPQVRAAHAGSGHADDRVGRVDEFRVVTLFEADVAGGMKNGSSHDAYFLFRFT